MMTHAEWVAFESQVEKLIRHKEKCDYDEPGIQSIIAAFAELKQLRKIRDQDCMIDETDGRCMVHGYCDGNKKYIDRLRGALRNIVQWADPCWTGGYAGDPRTPHPAWGDVQEGRSALKAGKR